jgi:TPR repeat protein
METRCAECRFFTLFLLAAVLQLYAAPATNTIPVIQESWENISNKWGNVSWDEAKKAAFKGDVLAEYYVGCAYQDGNGVDKDLAESLKWKKLAADGGLVRAQNAVGSMFYTGTGALQDYSASSKYFLLAAENGNASAQSSIGYLYSEGLGATKDINESIKWYRKAADQGFAEAQRNLGYAYENGMVGSTNYEEAAKLIRLAATQGDSEAQNNLGWLLANGQGIPKDYDEAQIWFQKAADQENQLAINNLSWLNTKVFDEQYGQARKYQIGDGVSKDPTEAFKWMEKAAKHNKANNSDVIYYLGLMYKNGEGVATNVDKARELLLQAADGSQPDACYWVGIMFENGDGVPKDDYRATRYYYTAVFNLTGRRYFAKAADCLLKLYSEGRDLTETNQDVGKLADSDPANFPNQELANKNNLISSLQNQVATGTGEFYLAEIYRQGILVPQNLSEAAARYQVATDEGVENARKYFLELNAKLSTEQKISLTKRIQELKSDLTFTRSREDTAINYYHW